MPRITPPENLDNVQSGFDPMPAGRYTVVVVNTEIKTAQSSGNQYMSVQAEVRGVPEGAEESLIGRKLYTNLLPFNANSLWKLKEFMQAAEIIWDETGFDTEDFLGASLDFTVNLTCYCSNCKKNHPFTGMENLGCPKCGQDMRAQNEVGSFLPASRSI